MVMQIYARALIASQFLGLKGEVVLFALVLQ